MPSPPNREDYKWAGMVLGFAADAVPGSINTSGKNKWINLSLHVFQRKENLGYNICLVKLGYFLIPEVECWRNNVLPHIKLQSCLYR